MFRRGLTALFLVLTTVYVSAQLPVAQRFLSIPDTLCPYLDMKQRVMLLEYANHNTTDSVENIFGGKSIVLSKADNCLELQVADGFTMTILADSASFLLIQTACAPLCSSIVKRYVANWIYVEELKPDKQCMLPKAEVIDGRLSWSDQTPLLLDDEEKKYYD
ncbi:MAG: DUF3256 family protein [Paludibacteraceae bacterium]|nr:DUF3256 family protein [Paludibacteraceae bacterium]